MLREIRNVEPISGQDVGLAEWIFVAGDRVETLVDLDVHVPAGVFQTRHALARSDRIDRPLDRQHAIGAPKLEMNPCGFRKADPLERLDRHHVVDHQKLASTGEEPANIYFVTAVHDTNAVAL